MKRIAHYYPDLSKLQLHQLGELKGLYEYWNAQINVISRKDMDSFYLKHVLHSMSISKVIHFTPRTSIMDAGTGGGFPGIPLAILFPDSTFTLVDSIGKKTKVVKEVSESLNLKNVKVINQRAERVEGKFDFIVSRAVTKMDKFIPLVCNKIRTKQGNTLSNGILYLKGGDLTGELKNINRYKVIPVAQWFEETFFETKKIIHVVL